MRLDGVRELNAIIRNAPRDVKKDMKRTAKREVSEPLARAVQQDGRMTGFYASRISARSTRAGTAQLPVIRAGGARKAGVSGGATMGDLIGGSEFGSRKFDQFRPHNAEGYWFFPGFKRRAPEALKRWKGIWESFERRWAGAGK